MAASKDHATPPSTLPDADIDLAGYDPYIVAITGGEPAVGSKLANDPGETMESRKAKLMTWLRENGA